MCVFLSDCVCGLSTRPQKRLTGEFPACSRELSARAGTIHGEFLPELPELPHKLTALAALTQGRRIAVARLSTFLSFFPSFGRWENSPKKNPWSPWTNPARRPFFSRKKSFCSGKFSPQEKKNTIHATRKFTTQTSSCVSVKKTNSKKILAKNASEKCEFSSV